MTERVEKFAKDDIRSAHHRIEAHFVKFGNTIYTKLHLDPGAHPPIMVGPKTGGRSFRGSFASVAAGAESEGLNLARDPRSCCE
jgi:hypothetical protein